MSSTAAILLSFRYSGTYLPQFYFPIKFNSINLSYQFIPFNFPGRYSQSIPFIISSLPHPIPYNTYYIALDSALQMPIYRHFKLFCSYLYQSSYTIQTYRPYFTNFGSNYRTYVRLSLPLQHQN